MVGRGRGRNPEKWADPDLFSQRHSRPQHRPSSTRVKYMYPAINTAYALLSHVINTWTLARGPALAIPGGRNWRASHRVKTFPCWLQVQIAQVSNSIRSRDMNSKCDVYKSNACTMYAVQ
jgi:hypothetical protein